MKRALTVQRAINKLTKVEEVLVKFLRRLPYNLAMNQKEVSIDNTAVTKLANSAYLPQSTLI